MPEITSQLSAILTDRYEIKRHIGAPRIGRRGVSELDGDLAGDDDGKMMTQELPHATHQPR